MYAYFNKHRRMRDFNGIFSSDDLRTVLPNNALGHDPEVVAVVLATEHGATVLDEVRVGGRCLADGLCTYGIRHGRPKKNAPIPACSRSASSWAAGS